MMGDIGLFISTYGGIGLFIYYLLNQTKEKNKEQIDAINNVGSKVDTQTKEISKNIGSQTEAMDDLSFLILDLLDSQNPDYGKRRNTKILKQRLQNRAAKRDQTGTIQ